MQEDKRTKKALQRWPPDPAKSAKGPYQRKSIKRLKGLTPSKDQRQEVGLRRMQDFLRNWRKEAEQEEEGNNTHPDT